MSSMGSRESRKRAIDQARAAEARRRQRLRMAIFGGVVVVVGGAGLGIVAALGGSSHSPAGASSTIAGLGTQQAPPAPGPPGPEGVPVPNAPALAGTAAKASGQTVDGISCNTSEQTLFHIHAHLTIFVNGTPRQVPAAIGIPGAVPQNTPAGPFIGSGTCFYWLHTHAADGIVHIESPVQRTFTLGDFFDEWGQPLGPGQAGPASGHVTVLYNGTVYKGDPRDVPLTAHAQIQLEVGAPLIGPESISWTATNGL